MPKEFDIMNEGMKCLAEHLGLVEAEKFVAAIIRENFDYTEWRRKYFDAKTPEEISREAAEYAKAHPFTGKAVKLAHPRYPDGADKTAGLV